MFAAIIPTAPACCTAAAFSVKLASPRTTSAMCPEIADAFAIAVCALRTPQALSDHSVFKGGRRAGQR